jgi:hypothetical protein
MLPEVASSRPVNMLIVVDLPAPLWPNKQNIYPPKKFRDISSITFLLPKFFVKFFSLIRGGVYLDIFS